MSESLNRLRVLTYLLPETGEYEGNPGDSGNPGSHDEWNEWGRYVLKELEQNHDDHKDMLDLLGKAREDIAGLKVKAGVWGLIAGSIPVVIAIALGLLR